MIESILGPIFRQTPYVFGQEHADTNHLASNIIDAEFF
jgi:hypothetical protein